MPFSGILLSILGILSFVQLIGQPSLSDIEAKVDELCASWKPDGPGGAIGIIKHGELIFSKAYGLASLEYDVPNTTETVFNIASVSKQFTAYALVLLEQQGKLSLDDDIRKHLPEVPDFGEVITIRHLLHHTSGLRNFQNMLAMAGWRTGESMTNDDLLRFTSHQKELNFPTGSEYLYCNSGFALSTFIVERVTGETYQDWTRKHMFEPLGMMHTGYREDLTIVHKNTATSYEMEDDGSYVQPHKYWTYMGNGNIYTTLADLAKWVKNFRDPKLGGSAGIQTLTTPGILTNGDTLSYAQGIGVGKYRGLKRFSHGGSVGGYRSNFYYFPELEAGFIALANFSRADPGGKVRDLIDFYLADKLEPEPESAPARYPHVTESVAIDTSIFDTRAGSFLVEGVRVEVYREAEKMYLHAKGVTPVLGLKAASDTSFFVPGMNISAYILPGVDGKPDRIIARRGVDRMSGTRIDPTLSQPEGLKQFTGTFYSPELDTEYHLVTKEGKLIGQHRRHNSFEVTPVHKDFLTSDAFYFRDIKIERWASGEIKGLRVSNGRVRDLWFEKR